MIISRRQCLQFGAFCSAAGVAAALPPGPLPVKIGAMTGSLMPPPPGPGAFGIAEAIGLQGVEIDIGRDLVDGRLPLSNTELQQQYLAEARKHKMVVAGVVLDVLHRSFLKSDPAAPPMVAEGIQIARKMEAGVLLLPFFNQGSLTNRAELARVADILKEHVRAAEAAHVVIGLEDLASAEDNGFLIDRVGSGAVKVYYDVGNTTNMAGFNAPAEIRWLGGDRIAQIHLKDKPYLGEGKVDFPEVFRAIRDSGFRGFMNFETGAPSGDRERDLRRNLEFVRSTLRKIQAEG